MKKKITLLFVALTMLVSAQNLIENPGFEEGSTKWISAGADFEAINQPFAGDSAVMISVTTQKYNGIRTLNDEIELVPGDYVATFWAKAANDSTDGKKASVKVSSTISSGLDSSASVVLSDTEWRQVKKEFVVTNADKVKLLVRANNVAQEGMIMYVDNVELVREETGVFDSSFEINPITLNWTALGDATIHRTSATDSVHSGLNACVFTVNAANDGFKNKADLAIEEGAGDYKLSVWVKGEMGENCQLRAKTINSGGTSYLKTDYVILASNTWEQIELPISMTDASGTITPMFRQVTFDTQTSFAIDDFEIEKQIPTSIEEKQKASLELYPNPASSTITLRGVESGTTFEIYSITGMRALHGSYQTNSIDVSSLSQGVYYLKTANNVARFIKEK